MTAGRSKHKQVFAAKTAIYLGVHFFSGHRVDRENALGLQQLS